MRYAEFLKEGGTIGFVAPSFGANIEPYYSAFDRALENLTKKGYSYVLGPNCYAGEGIGISNTPEKCGEELETAYCDTKSQVLISCGGGEEMCEILDYVNFDNIREAAPKWYLGYSDNTNFTFLLTTLCDTASIYGPCAGAFGMEPWDGAVEDAFALLHGKKLVNHGYPLWEKEDWPEAVQTPYSPYHLTEKRVLHGYAPVNGKLEETKEPIHMEGRLIGGCLDCLVNLVGTRYDKVAEFVERYKEDGIIWFLESCDLNVFSIRRAMWHLEHAGWFPYTKGFLIGRPLHFDEPMMGLDQYHAVTDIIAHHNVPVIMDIDLGHLPPQIPIVCGSMGIVDLDGQYFTLRMELK